MGNQAPKRTREGVALLDTPVDRAQSEEIIAVSQAMKRILRLVDRIASTESSVLITGDSGTGKEKVARLIHIQSMRSQNPFVAVNAGAIPEPLIESQLFGHAKGAFTDAKTSKRGFFEMADRGTLFLDEIAEMSSTMQVHLLRALQEKEIRPVGSEKAMKVDVRIVAATNRDLRKEMLAGRFREDLFYRLNVFHMVIPPLRDRREDIPFLSKFFMDRYSELNNKDVDDLTNRAWGVLLNYDFPGNVRELENAIERGVILSDDGLIHVRDLPPEIGEVGFPRLGPGTPEAAYADDLSLAEVEARHIIRVIKKFEGNLTKAAKSLGISRSTLWRKMKRYGIQSSLI
jgi:transcriptional regulator with PAS, ATPase and Fis domain